MRKVLFFLVAMFTFISCDKKETVPPNQHGDKMIAIHNAEAKSGIRIIALQNERTGIIYPIQSLTETSEGVYHVVLPDGGGADLQEMCRCHNDHVFAPNMNMVHTECHTCNQDQYQCDCAFGFVGCGGGYCWFIWV